MGRGEAIVSVEYLDGDREKTTALTRSGRARVELANGDVYVGEYGDDLTKHGQGEYTWAKSGATYKGEYANGKKDGQGRYEFPNGDIFEGSWKDGSKHGFGKESFKNGDVFEGNFELDRKNGAGTYRYASGAVLTGTWEDGEFKQGNWSFGEWKLTTRGILSRLGKRISQRVSRRKAAAKSKPLGIIISGAPASGKGTQCEYIREEFGVVHLSTGDMLRAAVAAGSELGRKAKALMESGQLVPDEIVIGAVKERLEQDDVQENGFLLDGFPRTAAQAEALADLGIKVDIFLMLNVPDEALVARVVGRRIDPETGNSYHVEFNPPPAEVEDRVIQRADDTEEKVKVRLQGFHNNIAAIKSFYTDVTVEIDGIQAKETVWDDVQAALNEARAA